MRAAKNTERAARPERFRSYPGYKDSGVEWLGEIPAHWEVAPVYARYQIALGKMLDAKRVTGESSGRYLRNIDVQWDAVNTEGLPEMDFAPGERDRYLIRPGDLLVCEGGEVGRTAIWGGQIEECFYQKAIHRVRPHSDKEAPRFFYYLMYTLAKRGVFVAGGNPNTIDHLTAVQLRHYRLPFAPTQEQRAIAAFLDRETARIDALVAKKERLIELLQEKRTALITRTVTKGLDPNVPMKDSGVEWLGEIPAHWEVRKTTWIFTIGSGTTPRSEDPAYYGGETPWITTSELRESEVVATEKNVTGDAVRDHPSLKVHPKGSVAVAMYGATIGRLGILGVPATVNQACCVFSRPRGIETWYWFYWLQMRRPYLISLGYGGGQPNLSQDLLRSLRVPTPPLLEQRAIISFLDLEAARIDALIAKVREAIERLKELRTALISAAVTGKIDVRKEVA